MTIELLFLSMVTSAIIGLPIMRVVAPAGSLAILAWSRVTAITPVEVSGRAGEAPNASANAIARGTRDNIGDAGSNALPARMGVGRPTHFT
jgi:hypothetical protein